MRRQGRNALLGGAVLRHAVGVACHVLGLALRAQLLTHAALLRLLGHARARLLLACALLLHVLLVKGAAQAAQLRGERRRQVSESGTRHARPGRGLPPPRRAVMPPFSGGRVALGRGGAPGAEQADGHGYATVAACTQNQARSAPAGSAAWGRDPNRPVRRASAARNRKRGERVSGGARRVGHNELLPAACLRTHRRDGANDRAGSRARLAPRIIRGAGPVAAVQAPTFGNHLWSEMMVHQWCRPLPRLLAPARRRRQYIRTFEVLGGSEQRGCFVVAL